MRFSLLLLVSVLVCLVQFNWAVEHLHATAGINSTEVASDASDGGYDGTGRLILIQEMFQFSAHARVIRDDSDENQGFYRRGRRSPGGKGYAGPSGGSQYKTSPLGGQSYGAGANGRRY